jgi:hypothetical protein
MKYRVEAGSLTVKARSRLHDTTTVWSALTGEVEADAATLATAGAVASFVVDMTKFDAGDWLKNKKLRSDFQMDAHPQAKFSLRAVRDVVRAADGGFTAIADGVLAWRGREVELTITGKGTLDDQGVSASATFPLDIRKLGMQAPRFLMFKVEDEVSVDVTFRGTAHA